jgi:hypothetical protein
MGNGATAAFNRPTTSLACRAVPSRVHASPGCSAQAPTFRASRLVRSLCSRSRYKDNLASTDEATRHRRPAGRPQQRLRRRLQQRGVQRHRNLTRPERNKAAPLLPGGRQPCGLQPAGSVLAQHRRPLLIAGSSPRRRKIPGPLTTAIAAEMTGRRFYAIEISPTYCDVAILRWQYFAEEEATLDGRTFAKVKDARYNEMIVQDRRRKDRTPSRTSARA